MKSTQPILLQTSMLNNVMYTFSFAATMITILCKYTKASIIDLRAYKTTSNSVKVVVLNFKGSYNLNSWKWSDSDALRVLGRKSVFAFWNMRKKGRY